MKARCAAWRRGNCVQRNIVVPRRGRRRRGASGDPGRGVRGARDPPTRERRAPAPPFLVLGQGQPGDRGPCLCRRRSEARALLGSPRVDALGRRSYLLPDRLCEPAARDAAVGDLVRDEAARSPDPAVRGTAPRGCLTPGPAVLIALPVSSL